jgi:hypothetical protein
MEIGMLLQWVRAQVAELRLDLDHVRAAGAVLVSKVARIMSDETRTINYRTESAAHLREDEYRTQAAYLTTRGVAERLAEVTQRSKLYTRSVAVRQARFTPSCILLASFTDGEKRTAATLADLLESSERLRWGADLERMDQQELEATLDLATDAGSLAILGALIREARRRAMLGDDGMATFAHRCESVLRSWDIPEIDQLELAFREATLLGQWIDQARTALATGEDAGQRAQVVYEAQRAGKSNDQIRAALAAAA